MEHIIEKDKWQIKLDKQLTIIKECQKNKQLTSCMNCKELLDCKIRDTYVNAVYESMNKGTGGGFEF